MNNEIKTENYTILYNTKEPSRTSDYDYDPEHPDRRFISMYINELEIKDKFTDESLIKMNFSSETHALLVSSLYKILYTESPNLVRTYRNIYIDGSPAPAILSVVKSSRDLTIFTFIHPKFKLEFEFSKNNIYDLMKLLDTEEINSLYDFK